MVQYIYTNKRNEGNVYIYMKPELTNVIDIIKHLKEINVEPYYINDDYLYDLVENEEITDKQLIILEDEPNLKNHVNEIYVPKEPVELPEEIIQAIKSAKELDFSIDGFCIDWSCGIDDYDFDLVVMNWLKYISSKERYDKIRQIYYYATQNWDKL